MLRNRLIEINDSQPFSNMLCFSITFLFTCFCHKDRVKEDGDFCPTIVKVRKHLCRAVSRNSRFLTMYYKVLVMYISI